jgi:hypothetical protein
MHLPRTHSSPHPPTHPPTPPLRHPSILTTPEKPAQPPRLPSAAADAPLTSRARLLSGRALAHEGLSNWSLALDDYNAAIQLAAAGGESPDPYVINSRGNCHNSLGEWGQAREDYLAAAGGWRLGWRCLVWSQCLCCWRSAVLVFAAGCRRVCSALLTLQTRIRFTISRCVPGVQGLQRSQRDHDRAAGRRRLRGEPTGAGTSQRELRQWGWLLH